jgi:hypothetical protein
MTCGSSEPLVTAGARCCPDSTVAARTQRGPTAKIRRQWPLYDGVAPRRCAVAWACERRVRCPRWGPWVVSLGC